MRAVLIFLLFIMCMHLDAQEELFFRFLKKAKTLDSFDNLKFTALNESEYNFLDGSNRVVIPLEDSIPYKEFNVFVNNSLYPVKTKKEFPIIVSKNNKGSIDSVRITDIGVLKPTIIQKDKICIPKIFPICKKEINTNLMAFILLTSTNEGVYVDMYIYSKKAGRVISCLPLFNGEKINKNSCELLGKNLVSSYQTSEIKEGIISQTVNDGFNDLWERKVKINSNGYFEIFWNNNTE